MVGERKKLSQSPNADAMEVARQAYLKENLPKGDGVLSLHKSEPEEPREEEQEASAPVEEHQEEQPKEREYSAVEKEAMSLGWAPEEEFRGDKSKWRDARSWIDNTRIAKELSETKRLNAEILDYLKSKDKKEADITISDLKQKKRDAIAAGDVDLVEKIEAQMESVAVKTESKPITGQNPPEVDDFLRRNEWFHKNEDMKQFAIDAENRYAKSNPSMSLAERLKKAEQDTLRFYDQEEKPNVAPAMARSGSVPRSTEPKYDELDSMVRGLVDHYVTKSEFTSKQNKGKTKPITRGQYISKLYKSGTIDKTGHLITSK